MGESGSRGFFSLSPHTIRRRIKAMAGQAWHPPGRARRFTELILRLRSGRRSRIQIENDVFDFK